MNQLLLPSAVLALGLFSGTVALAQPAKGTGKPAATKPDKTAPKSDTKGDTKTDTKEDPKSDKSDWGADDPDAKPNAKAGKPDAASGVEPPPDEWDPSNVEELPGKTYMFIGLRYRGTIVPKFMINLFVDEGKTVYSNTIGAEFDLRKDGFSLIPALSYTEYGSGDILFKQKNTKDIPGNYSVVNSSMKAIYATADLLWSTKLSKNIEFEYGAGFGVGVVFGDLQNNWVQLDPTGNLVGENGQHYKQCPGVLPAGSGCNAADHQNSDVNKVNGYTEPNWFSGGSKPVVFPWIAIPQFGLRFKPIKQFVGRLSLGFSLTGFWFGLSGEYGLEQKPKP